MVLYTAKDAAADRDPRRFHMLPPQGIAGWVDASAGELQAAYGHIDAQHRAPCVLGQTPLVVHRMTVLGIANDINYVIRSHALSVRKTNGGQLLLLPPARAPAHGRVASNNRAALANGRGLHNPWHWLDGVPNASLATIFTPSSCQTLLQHPDNVPRLRALDVGSRNGTLAATAERLGLGANVIDASQAVRAIGRGMLLSEIPLAFRHHGMLWWWQALTTYLVRVREPVATRLRQHPAMRALLARSSGSGDGPDVTRQREWLDLSRLALRRAIANGDRADRGGVGDEEDGLGWIPSAAFDAALHIRMGDACGPRAKRNQGVVRKCVLSLRAGLAPLLAHGVVPRGGQVFLATDSQSIAEEADRAAAQLPFEVFHLRLDRGKYDSEAWIELASARKHAQSAVLEETLLDVLLLSRARYIAGSMYGNVPRLALQLRPTAPGDLRRLSYITTDGRDWCTSPSAWSHTTIEYAILP